MIDAQGAPGSPETAKWEPLTPQQVVELLRGVEVPWWIAGGWALDLFAGRQTRAHEDIEISVFRSDENEIRRHLSGWEFFVAKEGTLTPLGEREPVPATAHGLWGRERGSQTWQLEILIEEREHGRWVYRRDEHIGAHEKDIGRLLDAAQRATLSPWISADDPTHRWLVRLRF